MGAKRRQRKMQRQRRVAGRGPRPPQSSDDADRDDLDDLDDLDDSSFFIQFDPVSGTAVAVPGGFPGGDSLSNLVAHLVRNDGLAADQLPAGALAEMLREHACPTLAQNDAKTLGDGCEAWYRWPVGNGIYIDLQLYHAQGRLQLPESLMGHPEVEAVMGEIITAHYIQQPRINRALQEQGAEAAMALIDAIPIHLFSLED